MKKSEQNKMDLIKLLDNLKDKDIYYKEINTNSFKIFGAYFKELIIYPIKCKVVFISPHNEQINSCNYNSDLDLLEKLIISGKYQLNDFNDLVEYDSQ